MKTEKNEKVEHELGRFNEKKSELALNLVTSVSFIKDVLDKLNVSIPNNIYELANDIINHRGYYVSHNFVSPIHMEEPEFIMELLFASFLHRWNFDHTSSVLSQLEPTIVENALKFFTEEEIISLLDQKYCNCYMVESPHNDETFSFIDSVTEDESSRQLNPQEEAELWEYLLSLNVEVFEPENWNYSRFSQIHWIEQNPNIDLDQHEHLQWICDHEEFLKPWDDVEVTECLYFALCEDEETPAIPDPIAFLDEDICDCNNYEEDYEDDQDDDMENNVPIWGYNENEDLLYPRWKSPRGRVPDQDTQQFLLSDNPDISW